MEEKPYISHSCSVLYSSTDTQSVMIQKLHRDLPARIKPACGSYTHHWPCWERGAVLPMVMFLAVGSHTEVKTVNRCDKGARVAALSHLLVLAGYHGQRPISVRLFSRALWLRPPQLPRAHELHWQDVFCTIHLIFLIMMVIFWLPQSIKPNILLISS